jgi:hypothetical protein
MAGLFLEASVLAEVTLTWQLLGGCWEVEGEWKSNTLSGFGGVRPIIQLVMLREERGPATMCRGGVAVTFVDLGLCSAAECQEYL